MPSGARARRAARWLAATAAVALLAAGCRPGDATAADGSRSAPDNGPSTVVPVDEGTPKDGGKLAFGLEAEPAGLDPVTSQLATPGHLVASAVFETLVVFDAEKNLQPYLAESIESRDLAIHWTITVKPNIRFHDGTAFNAEAVKANIDAQRAGIAAIGLKDIESTTVTSELVLEVAMKQPWSSFPSILAGAPGYMAAPASLGQPDTASHPVGTGPFVFDRWDRGTAITVRKNTDYWQAGKPHLDAIDFRIITDPSARANALAAGEVDMLTTDQISSIADYRTKPDYKVIIDDSGDAQSIYFNQGAPPFDNINARQAVILATDNTAITEALGAGTLHPIDQPFAEDSAYHQPDPHYPEYDLAAAKQAVGRYTAETGRPLEFSLMNFANISNLALSQILQEQWAKAGITAQIKSLEQSAGIKDILFGNVQAFVGPNFGYPDPDFNYAFWHSSYTSPVGQLSINFPHLQLEALDKVLLEGRVNLIPQQRQEAYKTAVQLINDDAAYVWLYRYVAAIIANGSVRGLRQAETTGFATYTAKAWFPDLWLSGQ